MSIPQSINYTHTFILGSYFAQLSNTITFLRKIILTTNYCISQPVGLRVKWRGCIFCPCTISIEWWMWGTQHRVYMCVYHAGIFLLPYSGSAVCVLEYTMQIACITVNKANRTQQSEAETKSPRNTALYGLAVRNAPISGENAARVKVTGMRSSKGSPATRSCGLDSQIKEEVPRVCVLVQGQSPYYRKSHQTIISCIDIPM